VSGTTAAASALRAAAGRTLLVMTTSEETTKEWRLGKLSHEKATPVKADVAAAGG